jgi:outer membrane biosynthesis protein TonB
VLPHQDRLVSRRCVLRSSLRVVGTGAIALGLTGSPALIRAVHAQDEDDVVSGGTIGTASAANGGTPIEVNPPDLTIPNVPEPTVPDVPQPDMTVPNVPEAPQPEPPAPQPEPIAPQPEQVAAPPSAPQPQVTLPNTGVGSAAPGGLSAAAGLLATGAAAAAFLLRDTSREESAEA